MNDPNVSIWIGWGIMIGFWVVSFFISIGWILLAAGGINSLIKQLKS